MLALFNPGGVAHAYSPSNAVTYAERWATSNNSNYPTYSEDCTNFVSQALHAGGYGFVGSPGAYNTNDDTQWWVTSVFGLWWHTNSWSVAKDQYNFQVPDHYPGGILEETVNVSNNDYWANYDNVNVIGGDVLFYDFGQGAGISHAAFQVYNGYSQYTSTPNSWYGDLSDQHSGFQYHNSWSHTDTNVYWDTTTIYEVHISSSN
jgi:hypothetical protein